MASSLASGRRRRITVRVLTTILAICVALSFALPLWWTFMSSLRPGAETFRFLDPISWETFVATSPTLDNYLALADSDLGFAILNSLIVSGSTVVLGLAICASAAFGLAAFRFRGQGALFAVVFFVASTIAR